MVTLDELPTAEAIDTNLADLLRMRVYSKRKEMYQYGHGILPAAIGTGAGLLGALAHQMGGNEQQGPLYVSAAVVVIAGTALFHNFTKMMIAGNARDDALAGYCAVIDTFSPATLEYHMKYSYYGHTGLAPGALTHHATKPR